MTVDTENLKKLALTIRTLSIDGVEKANSGHPGLPLGAADMAAVLWANYLRFNPKNPKWANRDRFVLSAGHGSMLVYSLLHLFGFDLPMSELKAFRQWESKTPGHPEFGYTAGVETTTGPLGQGFGNGVGMALSGKLLQETYSKDLFNYRVFGIVSDGDLMEGIAAEAASFAGHVGLGNIVYLYDDNLISLAGPTSVSFSESVPKRFEAYGWHVQSCSGHDMGAVAKCLDAAIAETNKPSIICARTTLGFGSPNKANTHDAHGSPLGAAEVKLTKEALGAPSDKSFYVPEEVSAFLQDLCSQKAEAETKWRKDFGSWAEKNPELAKSYQAQTERSVPQKLKDDLVSTLNDGKKDATRNISGKALQIISKQVPFLIGGSADLEPSTKTVIKDSSEIQKGNYKGRNIRYGVREHGMGAIANGLAYGQNWIPYTATFLVFADYMRPTIRLAALSHIQTLFIFTHDSFWVGEDGPTHEPIEHVMSLRAIPNLYVYRPADGIEVGMCYYAALTRKDRPSALLFTRQNVPQLERPSGITPDDVLKGGYIVYGPEETGLVIAATGSEVGVAVDAAKLLAADGRKCRVVSIPCMETFLEQPASYRESVIPTNAKKVSLEAGITMGWERIVGSNGLLLGIDHYGASAPGEVLAEKFGFVPSAVRDKIKAWI